jgi:hypothetical protein
MSHCKPLGIRQNAGDVPDIAWAYWSLVMFTPPELFGLYGLNDNRTELHERLCRWYNVSKEESKTVTDYLDECECAVDMHDKLQRISDKKMATKLCKPKKQQKKTKL